MARSVLTFAAAAAVLVAAACGARKTQTRGDHAAAPAPSAETDTDAPRPTKRVLLAWGLEPLPASKTKVYLAATDEMGRVVSHAIGEFDGSCTDVGAIELYRATIAVTCGQDGRGVQLHAVAGRGEVVVMAMDIAEGSDADPMARRQIARIETPLDAAISAAP